MKRKARSLGDGGFTLIELLVVISIIALLLSILMPALSKVKEQGKRIVCASQSKQVGLALAMYAQDNMDRFPVDLYDQSHWIWDVSVSIIDSVIEAGGTRETFYCPSNPKFNNDSQWEFGEELADGPYRVTGYYWFIERGQYLKGEMEQGSGHKRFLKKFTVKQASEAELVADAVMSEKEDDIFDAMFRNPILRTSHLKRGGDPAGGNILFSDIHVDWRKFDDMEMRWGPPVKTRGFYHWW